MNIPMLVHRLPIGTLKTAVGRQYVERMTNLDNLDALQADNVSVDEGIKRGISMGDGFNPILKMYVVSFMTSKSNGNEMMRTSAFAYRLLQVTFLLAKKKLATMPKDDTYLVRLDGLDRMELGAMQTFIGILMSFDEIQGLTDDNKLFAVQALRYNFSEISLLFSKVQRTEIEKRMTRLQKTMPKQASKLLQEMLDILQKQQ